MTQFLDIKDVSSGENRIISDSLSSTSDHSVYDIKHELKTVSPMNSPHKLEVNKASMKQVDLGTEKRLEIVEDSSNDTFTYLCSHPEVRTTPLCTSFTDLSKPASRKRSRLSMKTDDKDLNGGFVSRIYYWVRGSL